MCTDNFKSKAPMEESAASINYMSIISSQNFSLYDKKDWNICVGNTHHLHIASHSANISRETQGEQIRFETPAKSDNFVSLIKALE